MTISNREVEENRTEVAGKVAKRPDNDKFLGVLINDSLVLKNHASSLQKHVSMTSRMLNRVWKLISSETKLNACLDLFKANIWYFMQG